VGRRSGGGGGGGVVEEVVTVRAVCAFEAQKAHELSLEEGEVLYMCPHTIMCPPILLCICPPYSCICPYTTIHVCPHTTVYLRAIDPAEALE
jgi:hypothetical protein